MLRGKRSTKLFELPFLVWGTMIGGSGSKFDPCALGATSGAACTR